MPPSLDTLPDDLIRRIGLNTLLSADERICWATPVPVPTTVDEQDWSTWNDSDSATVDNDPLANDPLASIKEMSLINKRIFGVLGPEIRIHVRCDDTKHQTGQLTLNALLDMRAALERNSTIKDGQAFSFEVEQYYAIHSQLSQNLARLLPSMTSLRRLTIELGWNDDTSVPYRRAFHNEFASHGLPGLEEVRLGIWCEFVLFYAPNVVRVDAVGHKWLFDGDDDTQTTWRLLAAAEGCNKLKHFELETTWTSALLSKLSTALPRIATLGLLGQFRLLNSDTVVDHPDFASALASMKQLRTLVLPEVRNMMVPELSRLSEPPRYLGINRDSPVTYYSIVPYPGAPVFEMVGLPDAIEEAFPIHGRDEQHERELIEKECFFVGDSLAPICANLRTVWFSTQELDHRNAYAGQLGSAASDIMLRLQVSALDAHGTQLSAYQIKDGLQRRRAHRPPLVTAPFQY